ncbi:MAG: hypothetical protein QG670_1208 [Thermoproteota archaeon]|nr:hypothetical protein [Thermoproteota archaeon]
MANCTKCGTEVDHPLKTWKIKQTPVALYECPSCKTKWRGKFAEITAILPVSQPVIQAAIVEHTPTQQTIQITKPELVTVQPAIQSVASEYLSGNPAPAVVEYEVNKPVTEEVRMSVGINSESMKTTGVFSGIRMFFTNLFSGIRMFFTNLFSRR